MTLTLQLTQEQENKLQEKARELGVEPEEYLLRVLNENQVIVEDGLRPGETLLDGLKRIGAAEAFKSTPRADGRPWSEIEGYEFE